MNMYGFRSHKVLEDVTEGELDVRGSYLLVEVSNTSETTTRFYPNYQYEGVSQQGIPILAGSTRKIPMAVYHFKSDDPVTVVAYRQ